MNGIRWQGFRHDTVCHSVELQTCEDRIMDTKSIYDLKLHESLQLDDGTCVLRVPSGWIYDHWDCSTDTPKQGVFVPYDNRFAPRNTKKLPKTY